MTDEIKVIVEAIQSLGVEAKTAFIVYIIADKVFVPLTVVSIIGFAITKIAKTIIHLVTMDNQSFHFLKRTCRRLDLNIDYPQYHTDRIMDELDKRMNQARKMEDVQGL